MSSEEEDIELKRIRMKKMVEYLSLQSRKIVEQEKVKQKVDYVRELKKYLYDRGEEVLEKALESNREVAEQVAKALVKLIEAGRLPQKISGGDLLRLLRKVGVEVDVETRISVLKGGELKSVKDLLDEI